MGKKFGEIFLFNFQPSGRRALGEEVARKVGGEADGCSVPSNPEAIGAIYDEFVLHSVGEGEAHNNMMGLARR